MFSSDLKYNFETPEKAQKAATRLTEQIKADNGFSFDFTTEEHILVVKIKAESSELLRKAMGTVFPVIEVIEPEIKTE